MNDFSRRSLFPLVATFGAAAAIGASVPVKIVPAKAESLKQLKKINEITLKKIDGITFRTPGPWGNGSEMVLNSESVDNNFYTLLTSLQEANKQNAELEAALGIV